MSKLSLTHFRLLEGPRQTQTKPSSIEVLFIRSFELIKGQKSSRNHFRFQEYIWHRLMIVYTDADI
jgi:hypothetical protein